MKYRKKQIVVEATRWWKNGDHPEDGTTTVVGAEPFDILKRAFHSDPDYAWLWHCNIAMAMHDCGVEGAAANRGAHLFMQRMFEVDTKPPGEVASPPKTEGKVVRYFRRPDVSDDEHCKHCSWTMHVHGWIDTLEGGHIVCPGDWVITGIAGEHYPCKPKIFDATYELVIEAD